MARQLHIHVHVPVRGRVRDVSISGPLSSKVVRDEPSPYQQLVDELMRLMGLGQTQDDGQEGHPFYGNQYTNVAGLGPKPGGPTFMSHGLTNPGTHAKKTHQLGVKGDVQGLMSHYAMLSQQTNLPKTTAYTKAWLEHLGAEVHG